jgi:hypothetical protein
MICTCKIGFCLRDVSDLATPGLYRRASLVETFKESVLNPLYCTFIAGTDTLPSIPDAVPNKSQESPIKATKTIMKKTKRKSTKRKKNKNLK